MADRARLIGWPPLSSGDPRGRPRVFSQAFQYQPDFRFSNQAPDQLQRHLCEPFCELYLQYIKAQPGAPDWCWDAAFDHGFGSLWPAAFRQTRTPPVAATGKALTTIGLFVLPA